MSFLSRLFGRGKSGDKGLETLIEELMHGIFDRGGLELTTEIEVQKDGDEFTAVLVEVYGEDEALLTDRDGALLDSLQLFVKRAIQHNYPEQSPNVVVDSHGFRQESDKNLIELVEKLRDKALEQGRSVYLRQLAPKDRKTVHQFLADDGRVKSRSIGEGLFKKIKIYPSNNNKKNEKGTAVAQEQH